MKTAFFNGFERVCYVMLFLIIVCPVWILDYFHTGDGPAHLYCGHVLSDLLFNADSIFHSYFNLNLLPVPNALVQVCIALLLPLVSSAIANKIVVTLIIALVYTGYAYLVRILSGRKIFPAVVLFLIFCFPLKMGLYSLLAGFGLMMFALGYYIKHYRDLSLLRIFHFALLLLLTWLCHLFACAALLLLLFIYESIQFYVQLKNKISLQEYIKGRWPMLLSLIPVLLLAVSFSGVAIEATPTKFAELDILMEWISSFTVMYYFGSDEEVIIRRLFYLLMFSSAVYFLWSFRRKKSIVPVFLLLSIAAVVILFFCMPLNFFSGGLINLRLSYLSLILACVFVDVIWIDRWMISIKTLIIMGAVILTAKSVYDHLLPFSNRLAELMQTADKIEEGSVLLPVNYSPENFEYNFSLYLSCDDDIIVLDNAEAATPNGLVTWKEQLWKPKLIGNYLESSNPEIHIASYEDSTDVKIDYILTWRKENDSHTPPDTGYAESFATSMEKGILFKRTSKR
jgi:hypothetical protein